MILLSEGEFNSGESGELNRANQLYFQVSCFLMQYNFCVIPSIFFITLSINLLGHPNANRRLKKKTDARLRSVP